VTCSLPMSADDSRLVVARTSSGGEALARKARKAKVGSDFGTGPGGGVFGGGGAAEEGWKAQSRGRIRHGPERGLLRRLRREATPSPAAQSPVLRGRPGRERRRRASHS